MRMWTDLISIVSLLPLCGSSVLAAGQEERPMPSAQDVLIAVKQYCSELRNVQLEVTWERFSGGNLALREKEIVDQDEFGRIRVQFVDRIQFDELGEAANSLLKNAVLAFFNLAKFGAKLLTARKTAT